MSRTARLVEPGLPFHVTARGNYRQDIFLGPGDRERYLELLARHAAAEDLRLLGWCLMTNHVHLLVIPNRREALGRTMKRTQGDYAQYCNRNQKRRAGHLWQARFYSCGLDQQATWTALRYLECNPVRAGIVARAEASTWSSAAFHCGWEEPPSYLDLADWRQTWDVVRWREVLALGEDERQFHSLRQATKRGLPLGETNFMDGLRRRSGFELRTRPVGRPSLLRARSGVT